MSDLPERIAVKKLSGMLTLDSLDEPAWPDAPTAIYQRADLAPAPGYSREQLREALVQCVISDDKIDEILEALTPTSGGRHAVS